MEYGCLATANSPTFSTRPQFLLSPAGLCSNVSSTSSISSVQPVRAIVRNCSSSSISKCSVTQKQDSGCNTTVPSRECVLISWLSDVSDSSRLVSGYWVGPDMEDGWGLVEAFIEEVI